jgi:hypothetical protein
MKTCGCCGRSGPDEWFTTPAGDLCTRCRLARKRVKPAVHTSAGSVSRLPGKLAVRREQRAKLAEGIRYRLRQWALYSSTDPCFSAVDYFGCSIPELRAYIRSQLPEGYSWSPGYAQTWVLSFKRDLSTYRLEQPAQFRKATSFRNVRVKLLA